LNLTGSWTSSAGTKKGTDLHFLYTDNNMLPIALCLARAPFDPDINTVAKLLVVADLFGRPETGHLSWEGYIVAGNVETTN